MRNNGMSHDQLRRWTAHYDIDNSTSAKDYSPSLVSAGLVKALEAMTLDMLTWIEVEFRDGTSTQGVITEIDATTEQVKIDSNYVEETEEPDVTEFNLAEVYRFVFYPVSREQGNLQSFA